MNDGRMLLIEASGLEFQVSPPSPTIKEEVEKTSGHIILKGVPASIADEMNGNNRKYTTKILNASMAKLKKEGAFASRKLLCSANDHPEESFVPPGQASHVVLNGYIKKINEKNYFLNDWLILNTSSGKNLKALVDAGVSFGTSIRGLGQMNEQTKEIENYDFLGCDAVGNPSAGTFASKEQFKVTVEAAPVTLVNQVKEQLENDDAPPKVENYIENCKQMHGEAVVQTNLGALTPRVLDVLRIFYPNQILNLLADVQPLDGVVGSIFLMAPRFSNSLPANTPGRVLAGDKMFSTPTYYYASEIQAQNLGTGNDSLDTFGGALGTTPIRPNSVQVTTLIGSGANSVATVAVDDGAGALTGPDVTSGTIDYATGAISIVFDTAVTDKAVVQASFRWDSEANGEAIREIEFDMSVVPVQAKIHPLKFKYSVAAGLAASAHLAIDVQDTLAEIAGQFLKQERDNLGIKMIADVAPALSVLNFSATPSNYYDRQSLYADIELKLNEAESQIQIANGRGGVSWIVAGSNAANLFRNAKGFMPVPQPAPIGAHLIGYLRDGTIPVIKSLSVIDTNDYIVGYKGYMAGDACSAIRRNGWIKGPSKQALVENQNHLSDQTETITKVPHNVKALARLVVYFKAVKSLLF